MIKQKLLSDAQVLTLNERHGWFQFGDAQSDVSRAFANDAVAAYLRLRDAAPDYYEGVRCFIAYEQEMEAGNDVVAMQLYDNASTKLRAAHAKATGESA